MGQSATHEIEVLRLEIEVHNRRYYVDAAPTISDKEFDRLMRRLEDLERQHPELASPDSPTHRVGGQPLGSFSTITHAVPMLSIDNTYNFNEVREWDARIRKALNPGEAVSYAVELKVDGVAVSLRYEKGQFVLGATRGDGERGDDVTANLKTVRGVPGNLKGHPPELIEVRGEVYMTNAELVRLNEIRVAAEEPPFANPRNATAGSLKLLDPSLCATRRLRFVAHGLGESRGIEAGFYSEILDLIKGWNVPISPHNAFYDSIEEVIEHAVRWQSLRNDLDFPTDGLVVKVDNLRQRVRLGNRSKSPRWLIAYKYAAEQAVTKVVEIGVQVGKTGKLTPVAELSPVLLAGTTVRRASLHNADEIRRKDVRVGDTVVIQKAGEIIPQVVRVEIEARDGSETPFNFPTLCPSCGAPVEREAEGVDWRCSNPPSRCPEQLKESIRWFAHRDAMDIEGLGIKLIDQLVNRSLVMGLADLYRLDQATLVELERMGNKSAVKLIDAIKASKRRPLDRFLTGLTIRHVGTCSAEVLARRFRTLEALKNASLGELEGVPEIGLVVATSVFDFFGDDTNRTLLEDLHYVGVEPIPVVPQAVVPGLPLSGMTVVLTGTLQKRSRAEAEALIKKHGGKISGSVSKSTSLVLAGAEPGSKLKKAILLNIPIIGEDELDRIEASN